MTAGPGRDFLRADSLRVRYSALSLLGDMPRLSSVEVWGLTLEISNGSDIDERAWIDPEVTGLCGITDDELGALMDPAPFEPGPEPVPQPAEPHPDQHRAHHAPEALARMFAVPDDVVWERFSETTPPVHVED